MLYQSKTMTVYTTGTFDLLHIGHINLLEKCRRIAGPDGDVVVGVSTDEAYKAHKGKDPIQSYEDRARVVQNIGFVTKTIPHDQREFSETVFVLEPNIIVKGTDWLEKDLYKFYGVEKEYLDPYMVYVPHTEGISSTLLKKGYEL